MEVPARQHSAPTIGLGPRATKGTECSQIFLTALNVDYSIRLLCSQTCLQGLAVSSLCFGIACWTPHGPLLSICTILTLDGASAYCHACQEDAGEAGVGSVIRGRVLDVNKAEAILDLSLRLALHPAKAGKGKRKAAAAAGDVQVCAAFQRLRRRSWTPGTILGLLSDLVLGEIRSCAACEQRGLA